jgi:hypothetical protein
MPYPSKSSHEITKKWCEKERSISREETAYLGLYRWELLNIGDREYLSHTRMEHQVEAILAFMLIIKHKVIILSLRIVSCVLALVLSWMFQIFSGKKANEFDPILVY